MSSVGYVAAFRTYAWDEGIAELARRFFAAAAGSRQVVLVDETRGPIEISNYEKISHTSDTAYLGLPNHPPGQSLWFNVDYGIYSLQRQLPDYDYYLLSESDLAVNVSLQPMMRFAAARRIDFIAHQILPSTPEWYWHSNGLALSASPWRSLLFFMILSQRAISCLLTARRELAQRFSAGEINTWPFCETFVPTILKSAPGIRFAEVSAFAGTDDLEFRPRLSLHDPRANRRGTLVHSVLGGKKFIATLLAQHPPREFFGEGGELREGLLSQAPFENIAEPLRQAFIKEHDLAGVKLLNQEAVRLGWTVDSTMDLAFCMPALSSSVCSWSRYSDPERDACGANDDSFPDDYGFHTRMEPNPWWMVDLLAEHLIEEVAIVNRPKEPERFSTFFIETSSDGSAWTARFTQDHPTDVSFDVQAPWRMRFREQFWARYLRIILLGSGPLHLRRVQVFGRVLPARHTPCLDDTFELEQRWPLGPTTDVAFCKPAVSSSVCQWSRQKDPERDACGANDHSFPYGYAFHTRKEANPWWMVDFLSEHVVEEVAIINRPLQPERFSTFCIETSTDGNTWTARLAQTDPIHVSSEVEFPWRVRFTPPFLARYLRVILLGSGPLHLRRVKVFGRVLLSQRGPLEPEQRWPLGPTTDIAFCKPAVASSTSPWSRYDDAEAEAGANSDRLPLDCGFLTREENNPWWMVDFLDEHVVEQVAIVNRLIQAERFRTFRIETSSDRIDWATRFSQADPIDISTNPELPWRVRFADPFLARYLRVVLLGAGPLHLRRVQVFGRIVPTRSQAPAASHSSAPA
jgi:hypothetical protein